MSPRRCRSLSGVLKFALVDKSREIRTNFQSLLEDYTVVLFTFVIPCFLHGDGMQYDDVRSIDLFFVVGGKIKTATVNLLAVE